MKHFSTHALLLLLSLTWLVPKANAATYFSYSGDAWDHYYTYGTTTYAINSAFWFQGAAANGKIYTLPAVASQTAYDKAEDGTSLSYMISGTYTRGLSFDFQQSGADWFSCGSGSQSGYPVDAYVEGKTNYYYAGPAIAADNAETLWFPTRCSTTGPQASQASNVWAQGIKAVAYYTKDNLPIANTITTRKGINLSTYNIGRSDLMSAYGDGANGEGYLWFCDETNNKVVRVKIVEGQAAGEIEFTPPCTIVNRSLVVQYADNRVIYSSGRDGNKKIYRGVINGNSITWYDLGVTTVGNTTKYGSPGATMFIMGGYEYLAYSSSTAQVTINVYDGTNPANTNTLETFSLIPFGSNYLSSSSYMNHSINAVVANDKMSAVLYFYVPNKGAFKRKLTALKTKVQDPVRNLAVRVSAGADDDQPSRQDAVLGWNAPASGTVESYEVYYRTHYTVPGASTETFTDWALLGSTAEKTYTHKNIVYRHVNSIEYERHYDYKVIPIFESGGLGAESDVVTATPDFIPFRPIWDTIRDRYDGIALGIDRYDGYNKVQLYWKYPEVNKVSLLDNYEGVYGIKPDYYSIERNGIEIATGITAYNYIDQTVSSDQTYTYRVISHYNSMPDTVWSLPNSSTIEARDWSKPGYKLTEIYNYDIGASVGDSIIVGGPDFSNFTSRGSYAQGVFHDGYWYIAQLQNSDNTSGGIIKISAAAPWENKTENVLTVGKKIYNNTTQSNKGIACDEGGNLFIQSGTVNMSKTTETTAWYNCMYRGKILMNNGNGTYTAYNVDLTKMYLDEYGIYETNGSAPGRTEYYSMSGNLTGGTATKPTTAFLYLAPHVSRAVFVVKLTFNGSEVKTDLFAKYNDDETISQYTNQVFKCGSENFAYPVNCEGRENEFIHNIRSVAHSVWKNTETPSNNMNNKSNRVGTMYDSQSRVNTAGGCTFTWNGELFVVAPQSQYSLNAGNFYVGMAERKDVDDTPQTADLTHIIPADMWVQSDSESSINTSANGIWLYAEPGTVDTNGDGIQNDYAYIYMYVPGTRIAKYMLTPSTLFPPTPVNLSTAPKYIEEYVGADHNPGGDIERFDATASWQQVTDYGTSIGGNPFYKIKGYTLELVDTKGSLVAGYPVIAIEVDDTGIPTILYTVTYNDDGQKVLTAVDKNSEIYKKFSYTENEDGKIIYSYIYEDVYKEVEYTAQVAVSYVGIDESNEGIKQYSEKTQYEATGNYTPEEATGVVLVDVKKDNWSDWDADYKGNPANGGAKDDDDAYFDKYRVCLKLANPDFGAGVVYPRSYYTIGIDKDKNGTIDQEITEFKLFYGEQNTATTLADETDTTPIVDKDGYVATTDGQIPGDYNFDIETGGKPHVYWDMLDYTAPAYYDDGVTYTENDNPSTWNYIVTTTYAAGNARISEAVTSPMEADNGGITTGVEVISTQAVLNVYPIPATISVTIKCSEAVEGIEIYSESGMLVKKMSGNGEQIMTVNISDLASGYYFMRVNNLAPVRIIKN